MVVERRSYSSPNDHCVLHRQLGPLESLAACMEMGWMAILVSSQMQR